MIDTWTPVQQINEWIDSMVLKNIDPEKLKAKIQKSNSEHFEAGRRSKAEEMRRVLGML